MSMIKRFLTLFEASHGGPSRYIASLGAPIDNYTFLPAGHY